MKSFACLWGILLLGLYAVADDTVNKRKRCSEEVVCVHTEQLGRDARVYIENLRYFPLTVKLNFTTDNMQVLQHQAIVADYPGKSKTHAFTLKVVDESKRTGWKYSYAWQRGTLKVIHDDDHVYQLPFAIGSRHKLTQGFNGKFSHKGENQYAVDFQMPTGTKVHAARAGIVVGVRADSNKGCGSSKCRDDGNFIIILHSDDTLGEYFHLKYQGALVEPGQRVDKGQVIGFSGNTGWSSKPHLHFSVHSATTGKRRQSHPLLFKTEFGVVENLKAGRVYTAVE